MGIIDGGIKLGRRFIEQAVDYAYIRTAGDIKKFNMKYGLNLVLPAQA